MLEQLWTSILELTAQFVIPDWGKLIGLIPVLIVLVVAVILLRTFRGLATAPPARRGIRRIEPATPAGIHMPGPSWAPVFAAAGMFLLLLGFVFGGVPLILGFIALILTLLYWLGEGLHLYDRDIGPTQPMVPAVIHEGPPPGVHMPGPSWRPFLAAFGMFALLLGFVFGGWLLAVGFIVLIATLLGWLADGVREYRKTVEADRTGHLENIPVSGAPSRLLAVLVVLIVGGALLQSGVFVTGSASGGTGPGGSGAPAGGGSEGQPASSSGPGGSGGPAASGGGGGGGSGGGEGAAGDVKITAKGVAFLEKTITAPAGKPFTIAFDNQDPGTPHNVEFKDSAGGTPFKGDVFPGVAARTYQVPALPAGSYTFLCIVHPTMTGTATLQ